MQKDGEFDIRSYLRTVLDYKWLILITTVVVGAGVILWTLQQPRIYESSTTIEFDPNPATPVGENDSLTSYLNSQEYYATQAQRLKSRDLAERVIQELALHEDPSFYDPDGEGKTPDLSDLANSLRDRVSISIVRDTRIVSLSVRDRKAARAADIANTYATLYVEGTREDRVDSTETAVSELGEQLDFLRRSLEASELALHEFKRTHNILSVSMEDRQNLVAGEIETLNTALTEARQRRIEVAARLRRLRAAAQVSDVTIDQPIFDERSALTGIRAQLRAKLAERERASVVYGARHPTMVGLNREVAELQEQLENETSSILQSATADLAEVQSIEAGLRNALEQANEAGLELNLREIEYRRLTREQENREKAYQQILEQRTDRTLTQPYRPAYAEQIDSALEPDYPVAPNRTANAIGGVLAGLVLGILLAFALRFLDRRIRNPSTIEELGLTLLGVFPVLEDRVAAQSSRGRQRADYSVIVHEAPMSSAAECARSVRTNLTFAQAAGEASEQDSHGEGKVLLVTGSIPQEGKTTVATNLAASFAQSGKRVLTIECDLRRPKFHSAFGVRRDIGLTTYLVGDDTLEDIAQPTQIESLDAIGAGPTPPNPAELLESKRIEKLLKDARKKYDLVLIDSPPTGVVTDAAILAGKVQGVAIVVRHGVTTRDSLRSCIAQLESANAKIFGAILNDFDLKEDAFYGRGYYYQQYADSYVQDDDELQQAAE